MLKRARPLLGILALAATACSSTSLDGSIKARFSLNFTKLILLWQPPSMVIEYSDNGEVPCKLTINTTGIALKNGASVQGADFINKVTVHRIAADGKDYVTVLSGKISFQDYTTTVGGTVTGDFDAVFQDGYDVVGKFNGPLTSTQ